MNAARPSPAVAGTIAVVHDDYEALMTLTATFGGMHYSVTSAQSRGTTV